MRRLLFVTALSCVLYVLLSCHGKPTEGSDANRTVIEISSTPSGLQMQYRIADSVFSDTTPFALVIEGDPDPQGYDFRLELQDHFPEELHVVPNRGDSLHFHKVMTDAPDLDFVLWVPTWDPFPADSLQLFHLDGFFKSLIDDHVESNDFGWSPSRKYFTYHTDNASTVLLNKDRTVYATEAGYFNDGWSSTERFVAYGVYLRGIDVCDLETHTVTRILQSQFETYDHNPVFSPNDSLIAFVHHEWGQLAWIKLMHRDGSNVITLTDTLKTKHDASLNLFWVSDHELLFLNNNGPHDLQATGLFLLDIRTRKISKIVQASWFNGFTVSKKLGKFAFSTRDGLFVGSLADLSYHRISPIRGQMMCLDFAPDGNALLVTIDDGVYWVTTNGETHRIQNDWTRKGYGYLYKYASLWY